MTVKNCIPVPFSGTNSLVSLSVDLNFMYHGEDRGDPFDAMAVVTFLSSCPVLQDFSLALRNCRKFVASPLASGERLIIAGVEEVEFIIVYCNYTVLKSFLDVVRFPDVQRMRLELTRERRVHAVFK